MPGGARPLLHNEADPRQRSWRDASALAAVLLLGLYALLFAGWVLWGGGSVRERTVLSDLAFLPVEAAAAAFAWRAARLAELSERACGGWRLIALALLAWGLGDGIWCLLEVGWDQSPFPSVADLFYLSFYPLLLVGVARVTPSQFDPAERLRLLLDALTVTVASAAAVWVFDVSPAMGGPEGFLAHALNVAYPVGDVLMAFAIAAILLRRPPPATASALRVVMAGIVLFMAADVTYARMSLSGTYAGGDVPDALWMGAIVALLAGAYLQERIAARPAPAAHLTAGGRLSLVPYAAVLGGFVLVLSRVPDGGSALVVAIAAAFLIAVLVSVRQVLALRDNARLNAQLRLAAGELARALQDTQGALGVATEERERGERFLADAAHQLRTPITGVQASAETLLRGVPPEAVETLLHSIGRESARAGRIVSNLLMLARLDRDVPIVRAPTDVAALCDEEAERARAKLTNVHIELGTTGACHEPLALDRDAVREILANLLDNARRHARSVIRVSVARFDGTVDVRVLDDGPGLDPTTAGTVFERFVALDGMGGGGLGLAIARGLARAHEGDLTYEGGAFVLSLPVAAAAQAAAASR